MIIKPSYSYLPIEKATNWLNESPSFGRRAVVVGTAILTIPAALIEGVARLALAIFGGLAALFTLGKSEKVNEFTAEMGMTALGNFKLPIGAVVAALNPKHFE